MRNLMTLVVTNMIQVMLMLMPQVVLKINKVTLLFMPHRILMTIQMLLLLNHQLKLAHMTKSWRHRKQIIPMVMMDRVLRPRLHCAALFEQATTSTLF